MPVLGIDIGTTSCSVAVWKDNQVKIVPNDRANIRIPSCVAFTETEYLIGEKAKEQMEMNPKNTIYDPKQLVGRDFREKKFQSDIKNRPFVVTYFVHKSKIIVDYLGIKKGFFPEEIISLILKELTERAERIINEGIHDAVISVPVCFNDTQRRAASMAGKLAGLNVLKIINAPTAAALAYGIDIRPRHERIVLILDIGGGTTDVSIIKIKNGTSFVVKSTAGDIYLGGDDFDSKIVDHFCIEIQKKFNKNLKPYPGALRRLRTAAVQAKHNLSTNTKANVFINSLVDGIDYKIDYHTEITRKEFNCLCADLFERALATIKNALADAEIDKMSIDDVVLVGGSTKIPKIQSMVQDYFRGKSLKLRNKSEELVAYGAAIQTALLSRSKKELLNLRFISLTDIVPYSMGCTVYPGKYVTIVKRTAKIGCKSIIEFTTTSNNQQALELLIHTGENKMIDYDNFFGRYRLSKIPPAPAGVPCIKVSFQMNDLGVFWLTAKNHNGMIYPIDIISRPEQDYFGKRTLKKIMSNLKTLTNENIKKRLMSQKFSLHEVSQEHLVVKKEEEESYEFDQDDKNKIIKIFEETAKWLEDKRVIEKKVYIDKFMKVENMCASIMEKKYKKSGAAKKKLKDYISSVKQTVNDDCSMFTREKKNQVYELFNITEEWIHANELVTKKENFICMLDVMQTLINPIVSKAEIDRIAAKNKLVSYIESLELSVQRRKKYFNGIESKALVTIIRETDEWLKTYGRNTDKKTFIEELRAIEEEHNTVVAGSGIVASKALLMVNKLEIQRKFNDVDSEMPGIYVGINPKSESPLVKRIKYDNGSNDLNKNRTNVSVKIEKDEELEDQFSEEDEEEEKLPEEAQENQNLITNVSVKIEENEEMEEQFGEEEEEIEEQVQENQNLVNKIPNVSVKIEKDELENQFSEEEEEGELPGQVQENQNLINEITNVFIKIEEDEKLKNQLGEEEEHLEQVPEVQENQNLINKSTNVSEKIEKDLVNQLGKEEELPEQVQENQNSINEITDVSSNEETHGAKIEILARIITLVNNYYSRKNQMW